MIWLNLNVAILDSPEVVGSEPVERATWLFLLRFCVGQENGGRIAGCRNWKDRQWQQLARVTQAETQAETNLWAWDGDDLIVSFYPSKKEAEVCAKRISGTLGGKSRSEAKANAARVNGMKSKGEPKHNPSTTQAQPKQTPNGREGKGREGEGTLTACAKESGEVVIPISESPARPENQTAVNPQITPPTIEQVHALAKMRCIPPECAEKFFADKESVGWVDGRGQPIRNWPAALQSYAISWRANDYQRGRTPPGVSTPQKAPSKRQKQPPQPSMLFPEGAPEGVKVNEW